MAGWSNLTLTTDADLGAIEPQAIAAQDPAPWGASTWPDARAEAKRELKILIELAFPTVPGAADRILDRHAPDYVFQLLSSAYTDITSQAVDDAEEDVPLATILATSNDKIYVGADYQFEGLWVKLKDHLNAIARTLTVKYSGAAGWASLTVVDGTASPAGTPFAKSGRITWTIPSDWERIQLATQTDDEFFWIEISVAGALTAATAASQLLPIRAPDALKRVSTLLSLHYILNGLSLQAGAPEEWKEKAAKYREQALTLFQLLREQGGIPLDINRDEVTTTVEWQQTAPIRLGRA